MQKEIEALNPARRLNYVVNGNSSRAISCRVKLCVDIPPFRWQGLFTYPRYAVSGESIKCFLVILYVAQYTCTVSPENRAVYGVPDLITNQSV